VNAIREAPDEQPTGVAVNDGGHIGMEEDRLQRRLDAGQKLVSQAGALALVPAVCLLYVGRRRGPE
jgi:hypothetical protein